MPHAAVAMSRTSSGWSCQPVTLDDAEDLDALVDTVVAAVGEAGEEPDPLVVFVEEDDEWLGIVRLDGGGDDLTDPRVFLSDRRVVDSSDLANRLFADALPVLPPSDDDDESPRPDAEPAGETELLADLGTSGDQLVELCAEEGLLPADVITAIAERGGFLDVLDEVRGT